VGNLRNLQLITKLVHRKDLVVTITIDTLADLNMKNARRVAVGGDSITIGDTARTTMDRTRASYEAMLEAEPDLFI